MKIFSFVENLLTSNRITDIITVKAAEFKTILSFNQLNPIMTKQQSVGLRIRKTFPNEETTEDFYVKKFDYMIDFCLLKRKLAIEVSSTWS